MTLYAEDESDVSAFSQERTARKEHKCGLCLGPIVKGQKYKRVSWFNHDTREWGVYKEHTFWCIA